MLGLFKGGWGKGRGTIPRQCDSASVKGRRFQTQDCSGNFSSLTCHAYFNNKEVYTSPFTFNKGKDKQQV